MKTSFLNLFTFQADIQEILKSFYVSHDYRRFKTDENIMNFEKLKKVLKKANRKLKNKIKAITDNIENANDEYLLLKLRYKELVLECQQYLLFIMRFRLMIVLL